LQHRGENGADSASTIVLTCNFVKVRNDTFWVISHSADTRQIHGSSNWQVEVDGQPCRDRNNNVKGSIDAAFQGAGPNMHRPMYERGICYRTTNQAVIRAGTHSVRWRQYRTSGDSYWGWNSNSQIMVEVRLTCMEEVKSGGERMYSEGRMEGLVHLSALSFSALVVRTPLAHRLPCFFGILFVGISPMNTTVLDQSATTFATGHNALSGWFSFR